MNPNELSERIQKRMAREAEKHAALDDAADRTLAGAISTSRSGRAKL